jgi:hypothetical protein
LKRIDDRTVEFESSLELEASLKVDGYLDENFSVIDAVRKVHAEYGDRLPEEFYVHEADGITDWRTVEFPPAPGFPPAGQ